MPSCTCRPCLPITVRGKKKIIKTSQTAAAASLRLSSCLSSGTKGLEELSEKRSGLPHRCQGRWAGSPSYTLRPLTNVHRGVVGLDVLV